MEKQTLPNSNLVLIFGILSLLGCCCTAFMGIVFGIIGLIYAKKATAIYLENPENYTGFNNVKTGKILCIIGIVLGILTTIVSIIITATVGLGEYMEMFETYTNGM